MKIEHKEIITLDGKKLLRVTTSDERWYKSGETYHPSVTWICAYYPKGIRYMRWLAEKGWDEAEIVKNEAAEKGSRVHHACEDALKGKEIAHDAKYPDSEGEEKELSVEEYGAVMSFVDWLNLEQPIILGSEYTLINSTHGFAGTVDIKCRIKSDEYKFVHIIDIKTSQDIYPSHEIQVSAYKNSDPEAEKIDILQVGYKRNKARYKFTAIEDKFDIFLAAKRIWANETEGVVPAQKDYPLSLKWEKEIVKVPVVGTVDSKTGKIKKVAKKRIIKKKK